MHDTTHIPKSSFRTSRSSPTPDASFFYEPVFIQVSNSLFCVPREHLDIPGTVLSRVLNADATLSNVARGTHSSNPVVLPESVDLSKFRSFLKGAWRRDHMPVFTHDWVAILSLAHEWGFHLLKNRAITSIETDPELQQAWQLIPYQFIDFGREYNIKEWVIKGYIVLVNPKHSLGGNALKDHKLEAQMAKLFMTREAVRQYLDGKYHSCFSCRDTPYFGEVNFTESNHRKRNSTRASFVEVEYCDCGETVFAYASRNVHWQDVARYLIENLFEDELESVENGD